MSHIIEEALKLPKEEKMQLYYALQQDLDAGNNLAEEELTIEEWKDITQRREDIDSEKIKAISLEQHLQWINNQNAAND